MNTCKVPDCGRVSSTRGFCQAHYQAGRRGLDPFTYKIKVHYKTPEESIENRTKRAGDCLVWTGSLDSNGYGNMSFSDNGVRKYTYVHRYVYEQANGKLEWAQKVDHIFQNPRCVKLEHLRVATASQNSAYMKGASKNSSTGYRNVYYVKERRQYVAQVKKDRKKHYGGYHSRLEDAVAAAEKLREELFGEFAGRG